MTKQIYILLTVLFGFFLKPTISYACGKSQTKTEKSCCHKKTSQKDDCCKNDQSRNKNKNDDCGGKCGHSSCHCPNFNFSVIIPFVSQPKNRQILDSSKQIFYEKETFISSGFRFIWLLPKIS